MFDSMWAWLEDQFADDLHLPDTWPQWFRDAVVGLGLDVALDALADADAPFIGKHIHDELQGLADGSGVDVSLLRRTHLIAELTQGQCRFARCCIDTAYDRVCAPWTMYAYPN